MDEIYRAYGGVNYSDHVPGHTSTTMKRLTPSPSSESREIVPRSGSGSNLATGGSSGGGTPYGTQSSAGGVEDLGLEPPRRGWSVWPPSLVNALSRRYYVAVVAFLGFCNIYAMRVNLSIAIIFMTRNRTLSYQGGNVTEQVRQFTADYNKSVSNGVILAAFFYGYIVTQLPGGWFATRHGAKTVLGIGVLGTALLTLLTPPLALLGRPALILCRVAEGLFEGVTYPAMHAVWRNWAPPAEKTKLSMIAFSGSYFGTVISLPLSAYLGETMDWPAIFYVFGILAMFWCYFWFKTVFETPADDPYISTEELNFIHDSIGFEKEGCKPTEKVIPWDQILRSRPVWAIVAAHFAANWGFYTMLTYLPRFMKDVLHYTITYAGFLSALPYLAMGCVVLLSGHLADYLRQKRNYDTGTVRKLFCCGAFVIQSAFILLTLYSFNGIMAVLSVTVAIGAGGFTWAGFGANHLDIAPNQAGVLMGLSNTFATLPGMLSPIMVGFVVADEDGRFFSWAVVFFLVAFVYLVGAAVYWLFASGERQPWADGGDYSQNLDELHGNVETAAIVD